MLKATFHQIFIKFSTDHEFRSKVEDIEDDKKKEFEDSLNKFLAPYKKNAEKTGYLFGNSITLADIVMIMKCTMAR